MSTSALPRGKTTTLLLKAESAFGNPPGGDWTQTFAYSHTSDFRKPFEDDPLLGLPRQNDRDRTAPAPGLITFDDSIVVPLDFNLFGVWLHALFADASVTGSEDPYTHVFSSGLETLPWRSHEWKLAGSMFEQDVGLVGSRQTKLRCEVNDVTAQREQQRRRQNIDAGSAPVLSFAQRSFDLFPTTDDGFAQHEPQRRRRRIKRRSRLAMRGRICKQKHSAASR